MRIGKPELVEQGQEIQIRAPIEMEGQKRHLWYGVEPRYADCLTPERLDAFLLGLLIPAMMAGEDIYLEGPLSEKLYWNLTHYYMRIVVSTNRAFHPVRIFPAELRNDRPSPPPAGVATGFSGGIDSFCVLADHFFDPTPEGYRVTHLVFNNAGEPRGDGRRSFLDRYERLRPCAEELGIPLIHIDTNLRGFYRVHFQRSHPPRNISAALILQGLFGRFLYASAFRYEDCFVGRAKSAGYTDPAAIHLLSTETMESISAGAQYSRVEKTRRVAEVGLSHRYLNVCIDSRGNGNCGLCWKCARTLLTLELLGKASLYQEVFPLHRYRSHRHRCLTRVLAKNDPLTHEVLLLARQNHYAIPWDVVTLATVRRASTFLNHLSPRRLLRRTRWIKALVDCERTE